MTELRIIENPKSRMLNVALDTYKTAGERAAMRSAFGDAAALCDGLAREIAAANRGRNGKGAVTKLGLQLEAIAKQCGDEIWKMRDQITVHPI